MTLQARLLHSFALGNCGGKLHLADLDGDGRMEFLFRQSAGHLRSFATRATPEVSSEIPAWELAVNCLTAFDASGRLLWQVGEPFHGPHPFVSHGGDDLDVAEIDADGIPEIIVVDGDELCVYDAATGARKAARPLPADNFCVVRCGAVRGDPRRKQILVKVTARAYPPFHYGNPTFLLDGGLNEIWKVDHFHGSGHVPVFIDLDGDGCDELLIGYNLVDHDGSLLWTIPVENANADHADHILPGDFDGDGRIEIAYAGSRDYFLAAPDGSILWKRPHEHSQKTMAGRLHDKGWGDTIILNEKWIGMTAYTPQGDRLWSKPGVGYAQAAVRGWTQNGLDLVLYEPQWKSPSDGASYYWNPADSRSLWPCLLDGDGALAVELPWREEYLHPRQLIRGPRAYDFGVGFSACAADINADGIDEVILSDRRRVWIFGPPEA